MSFRGLGNIVLFSYFSLILAGKDTAGAKGVKWSTLFEAEELDFPTALGAEGPRRCVSEWNSEKKQRLRLKINDRSQSWIRFGRELTQEATAVNEHYVCEIWVPLSSCYVASTIVIIITDLFCVIIFFTTVLINDVDLLQRQWRLWLWPMWRTSLLVTSEKMYKYKTRI